MSHLRIKLFLSDMHIKCNHRLTEYEIEKHVTDSVCTGATARRILAHTSRLQTKHSDAPNTVRQKAVRYPVQAVLPGVIICYHFAIQASVVTFISVLKPRWRER